MALTVRADGQTIHSNWVNDYRDLLTGVMTDQPVTLKTGLTVAAIGAAPAAPSAAAATGSTLGIGVYKYAVTFVAADGGETLAGAQATVTTSSGNQAVNVTLIPTGPTGTTKRNIYRTAVGGSQLKLCHTYSDNTTTTLLDSLADTGLGANAPTHPSFGGSLSILDSTGAVKAQIFSDGVTSLALTQLSSDTGKIASDGNGKLTLSSSDLVLSTGNLYLSGTDPVVYVSRSNGFNLGANGSMYYTVQLSTNGGIKLWNDWTSNYGFQFLRADGAILAEMRASDKNFIIGGSTYYTNAGTFNNAAGQAFTGFDVAEIYQMDANYPSGTVVCPGTNGLLSKCLHDACHGAMVVSAAPGYCMGIPDPANNILPVALTGRLIIPTSQAITAAKTWLCSDGTGGVRPLAAGEEAFAVGFSLDVSTNGQVPVIIRPTGAKG